MKTLFTGVLGILIIVFAGSARAQDDNAKKIIGVWEGTKSGTDLPVTIEFTKDGKLLASIKAEGTVIKLDGTYKVEKDKLIVKIKIEDRTHEETATIKKVTDDALEIEDKDKKVDAFKKKKK